MKNESTTERVTKMKKIQYANFASKTSKEGYAILKRSIFANAVISEINLWTSSLENAVGYCEENANSNEWITILCDWDYSEHSNLEFELLVGKY
jgi:hypothetical protein